MKKLILLSTILILNSCFKKEISDTVSNADSTVVSAILPATDSTAFPTDSTAIVVDSASAVSPSPQVAKMDYNTADRLNTSEAWRSFLRDNPDYENKNAINEKIIRAEVEEISNSKDTGAMPQAEKLRGGSQAQTSVMVENDTSCELTLRYSGPDALHVVIAPNSKQKVNMRSGNYRVAATACGYNYAGSEDLAGDYEVVYYITTTRY